MYSFIRYFFVAQACLVAMIVSVLLTHFFPAPWYITGLYRVLPLLFLVQLTLYLLKLYVRKYYQFDLVLNGISSLDLDKPFFMEVIGSVKDETIVVLSNATFKESQASHGEPRIFKLKAPLPCKRGYVMLKGYTRSPNVQLYTPPS